MSKFILTQKTLYEIGNILQANSEIRKLLVYDTQDCLEQTAPSFTTANEYIVLEPVFDMTKEPYNKNTFINLAFSDFNYDEDENKMNTVLKIGVVSRNELWKIDNKKIRVIALMSLIFDELQDKKLSTSQKLYFQDAGLLNMENNVSGYMMNFAVIDGSGLNGEF